MSLTPNDIRNYEFSNQMRGFDKEEVENFLEEIAVSLEELKQVNLKLSMEAESMKTQLSSFRQHEDSIKQAMIDARRYADDTIAKAKLDADKIITAAQDESVRLAEKNLRLSKTYTEQISSLKDSKESFITKVKELVSDHLELINLIESDSPEINFDVKNTTEQEKPAEAAPVETTPEVTPAVENYVAPVETTPEVTPVVENYVAPVETTPEVTPVVETYVAPVETTPEVTPVVETYAAPIETAPVEATPEVTPVVEAAPIETTPAEATPELNGTNGLTVTGSEELSCGAVETLSDEPSDDPLLNQDDNNQSEEAEVGGTIINEQHEDTPIEQPSPTTVVNQEVEESSQIDPELAEALDKYQHLLDNKNESGSLPTPPQSQPVVQVEPAAAPKQGELVETNQSADEIPEGFVVGNEVPEQNSAPVSTDHIDTGKMVVPQTDENNNAQPEAVPNPEVSDAPQLTPDNLANEFDNIVAKFAEELEKAEQN